MSTSANSVPLGKRAGRPGRPPAKKAGPRPARHIPWPEIFKHHISLVEGHLKMIDMVRKHTVEGSGNHRTISNLVDRAHSMLKDAKSVQREFVAPKDAWQSVPIGSSSDTMYPGYSPKDHEYGKAAQEFGKDWSEARKRGVDFDMGPDGPEYQFGQSKGSKKRRLEASVNGESTTATIKPKSQYADISAATEKAQDSAPLFFFDSKPTPINALNGTLGLKASSSPDKAPAAINNDEETPAIEYENIDREVEARLKLKADAQKNKKENKRKRESDAPADVEPETNTSLEQPPAKKSRSKKKGNKNKTVDKEAAPSDTEKAELPSRNKSITDEAATDGSDTYTQPKKSKKNKHKAEEGDLEREKKRGKKSKSKE